MVLTQRQNSTERTKTSTSKSEETNNKALVGNGQSSQVAEKASPPPTPPRWEVITFCFIIVLTLVLMPVPLQPIGKPTLQHVFYYGWLTALSTGLGIVPLIFFRKVQAYWIGISNAIAAGMMIGASYSLIHEACTFAEPDDYSDIPNTWRTALGCVIGLAFILGTKSFLDQYEDLKVGGLAGTNARRALLVFFVMTVHSFSEGVGVGVSFGGKHGNELGLFISASLAVHNVPEGLAMAVVLLPRGTTKLETTLWCIATSMPQPLMAVPAYMFVNHFIPLLPVGLGFAGGAMIWVACMELFVEAIEDTNLLTTSIVAALSFGTMLWVEHQIDDELV